MHSTSLSSLAPPKTILVATDLTDLDFLLPVAIDQTKASGAMIWLLHVIAQEGLLSPESVLAKAAMHLKSMDIRCAFEVRRSHPAARVIEFVGEHEIERVILGTSSRGKLGKLLVGSVAEELIRSLHIPVCTVGPNCKPFATSTGRRIIFATSLRHDFENSFQFAVELVSELQGELTVVHVVEQDRLDDGVDLRIVAKIDTMIESAKQRHFVPQMRICYGEPAEEILRECAAEEPAFLVLSAVPASSAATIFRSGVAYRVIAEAPCPAFTLCNGAKKKHRGTGHEVSAMPGKS